MSYEIVEIRPGKRPEHVLLGSRMGYSVLDTETGRLKPMVQTYQNALDIYPRRRRFQIDRTDCPHHNHPCPASATEYGYGYCRCEKEDAENYARELITPESEES